MEFDMPSDILYKIGLFILVQALVYLILSKSSDVFSTTKKTLIFRPSRSVSVRRMLALLSDLPPGGEPSPDARAAPSTPGSERSPVARTAPSTPRPADVRKDL